MPYTLDDLRADPNRLAPQYSRFRVGERLLLTGHSHQAWPDRALDGQKRAWQDAAEWVDDKWQHAFAQADRVRAGYRELLGDPSGKYSLAANTFELLVRLFSSLPLTERPRIVSTDSEFYSLRRLLDRGLVHRPAGLPAGSYAVAVSDDEKAVA